MNYNFEKQGYEPKDGTKVDIVPMSTETTVSQTIAKPLVMGSGYWCSVAGDDVFIVAENIADCLDKLEMITNGQRFEMRKHKSIPVYHCP